MSFRTDYLKKSAGELARNFNVSATTHICVDLQKGYCVPPLPLRNLRSFIHDHFRKTHETIRNIDAFSQDFAARGGQNIWVRHDVRFTSARYRDEARNYQAPEIRRRLKSFAQQGAELCLPCHEDEILHKRKFSSFKRTPLATRLHEQDVSTVLLTGGFRDYCVAETALDARKRGFRTFIVDDLVISNIVDIDQSDLEEFCADYAKKGIFIVRSGQVKKILRSAPQITLDQI